MSKEKQLTPTQKLLFEQSNAIDSKESIEHKLKMGTKQSVIPIFTK